MATTTDEAASASTADPLLECDLVMKGGVTSGVIYPLAVCELAKVYRLRSIGGSSAGAIAAAAAAAAELGRASGGFERLARLPADLSAQVRGEDSRLFTLFQPQRTMRRLFGLLTAVLHATGPTRVWAVSTQALRGFTSYAAAGAVLGVLLVVAGFVAGGPAKWVCLGAGLLLAVVGVVLGIGIGVLRDVSRIPAAGYGLCSGVDPGSSDGSAHTGHAALTPWLHETLQSLAGRTPEDPPITFGDLDRAGITLAVMTTNLSRHQPTAMPWAPGDYFFDPAHFRTLFPEAVVAHMENAPASAVSTDEQWLAATAAVQALPMRPFPPSNDLPVLVAVRMSLSFPGLIAAVPLKAVDYSLSANQEARQAARTWRDQQPDASPEEGAAVLPTLELQANWFSDGGICANLPLHFFDSALPRRPTFAINLMAFPRDRDRSEDECDNSCLPVRNDQGLLRRQSVWEPRGLGALAQFTLSIVETARTWVDEAQLSMPGYRDRIVTVFHDDTEGGINLNMAQGVVASLSRRGECAATRLVDRFAGDRPGIVPAAGWDNHRWLRFRTATAALSETLDSFESGFTEVPPGTTAYSTWVGVDAQGHEATADLPSYPLAGERRHAVNERTHGLLQTAADWQSDPADAFTHGAPRPRPVMRLVPSEQAATNEPQTPSQSPPPTGPVTGLRLR